MALSLVGLANVYEDVGKYAEAETYYKRALAINEEKLGRKHPTLAMPLNNLANVYAQQGKYAEAEKSYNRALAIYQETLGRDHSKVAAALDNLAHVNVLQGKHDKAESFSKRGLTIYENSLGKDHPSVAGSFMNLANVCEAQGRLAEAEALYTRALVIMEGVGQATPTWLEFLSNLAELYGSRQISLVRSLSRAKLQPRLFAHAQIEATVGRGRGGLVEQRAGFFRGHVSIISAAARQNIEAEPALAREAFEIAQWAVHSAAAIALGQMAARQARGEGALAQIVRERQNLERQWHLADQRLDTAVGGGDVTLASEMRRELSILDGRLAAIDVRLRREFPDYEALSNPKPLAADAVQALLGGDEALLCGLPVTRRVTSLR